MCLPHGPLTTTPSEPDLNNKIDKHKAMVRYTDIILNKLVSALEKLKIRDNTIIFWTTDNGTAGVLLVKLMEEKLKEEKPILLKMESMNHL